MTHTLQVIQLFYSQISVLIMSENYFKTQPDKDGFFNEYGGAFLPPVLVEEMQKITEAYYAISKSHNFISELRSIRKHYQGRLHQFIIAIVYRKNMVEGFTLSART